MRYRSADVDVEVLVDGDWRPGHLRAWRREQDTWLGNVMWSSGPGENRLDWFPADRVRET